MIGILVDKRVELDRAFKKLQTLQPDTKEYQLCVDNIDRLGGSLEFFEKEDRSNLSKLVHNPALIGVLGNFAVAIAAIYHERIGIITSRAFGLVRPK